MLSLRGLSDFIRLSVALADSCFAVHVAYLNYHFFVSESSTSSSLSFAQRCLIFASPLCSVIFPAVVNSYVFLSFFDSIAFKLSSQLRRSNDSNNNSNINKQDNNYVKRLLASAVDVLSHRYETLTSSSLTLVGTFVGAPLIPVINYLMIWYSCYANIEVDDGNDGDDDDEHRTARSKFDESMRGSLSGDESETSSVRMKVDWKVKFLNTRRRIQQTSSQNTGASSAPPPLLMGKFSRDVYNENENAVGDLLSAPTFLKWILLRLRRSQFRIEEVDVPFSHAFLYVPLTWEMILRSLPNLLTQVGIFYFFSHNDERSSSSSSSLSSSSNTTSLFFTKYHAVSTILSISQVVFFLASSTSRSSFVGEYVANGALFSFDFLSTCTAVAGYFVLRRGDTGTSDCTRLTTNAVQIFVYGKAVAWICHGLVFVVLAVHGALKQRSCASAAYRNNNNNNNLDHSAIGIGVAVAMSMLLYIPFCAASFIMKVFGVLGLVKDSIVHDSYSSSETLRDGADYLAFNRVLHVFLFTENSPIHNSKNVVDWAATFTKAREVLMEMTYDTTTRTVRSSSKHLQQQDVVFASTPTLRISAMNAMDLFEKCVVYERTDASFSGDDNNNNNNNNNEREQRAKHLIMMCRLRQFLEDAQNALRHEAAKAKASSASRRTPANAAKVQERQLRDLREFLSKNDTPQEHEQVTSTTASMERLLSNPVVLMQESFVDNVRSTSYLTDRNVILNIVFPSVYIPTILSTVTEIWFLFALGYHFYCDAKTADASNDYYWVQELLLKKFLLPASALTFAASVLCLPAFFRFGWSAAVHAYFLNYREVGVEGGAGAENNNNNNNASRVTFLVRVAHCLSAMRKHEVLVDALDTYRARPLLIELGEAGSRTMTKNNRQMMPEEAFEKHVLPFLRRTMFVADD